MKDHLLYTYNYDPGKYKDYDPFKNRIQKFLPGWTGIFRNHKLTVRYNDVVGTSDQPTNSTSGPPNNPRNSGRISNQSMAFSNSFYGFKNTVRSFTGELNSNFCRRSQISSLQAIRTFRTHVQAILISSRLLISGREVTSICHLVMSSSAIITMFRTRQ